MTFRETPPPASLPQRVDVINYGGGNLGSLLRALQRCQIPYRVFEGQSAGGSVSAEAFPSGAYPIVLPGVGAFGSVMQALQERGFVACLQQRVQAEGVPLLGVCVGLQVLFESSEESPNVAGLGFLKGSVKRFSTTPTHPCKIPQMGWNSIHNRQASQHTGQHAGLHPNQRVFEQEGHVYYVNSYYAHPVDETITLYESTYGSTTFCGAVHHGNITAFQFHPEKSGELGHTLLKQWWHLVSKATAL